MLSPRPVPPGEGAGLPGQHAGSLTDAAVCDLPLFRLLIAICQSPEFAIEQRAYFREPGRWPDLGVKPGNPRPSR